MIGMVKWMDGWHIVELFDAQAGLLLVNNVLICVGVLKITKITHVLLQD